MANFNIIKPLNPIIINQSTQTINQVSDYNPLAWLGQGGTLFVTIAIIILGFLLLLYLLGGRSKGGFLRGKFL